MAEHRLALVVGANRGIGLGVTEAFLAAGWDVIATARRPAEATALGDVADRHRGRMTILPLEMTDPTALDGFGALLGDRKLDAVLINAGVAGPGHRSADAATEVEIGVLMFTNAVAPIRLARTIVPHLKPGPGVLAFSSSVMGSVAMNSGGGHELYRASKAALNSLTRGLWGELRGRNLTVLSLHPGWVRTDMGGAGAPVSVEESAQGIVRVIEAQSGAYQHRYLDYNGSEIAW
ncbi:MAG TPA: SDR family oxidoreductase [Rhodopila sp.]|uniref:SDR family oxidoreductase n=1 Tax=Rhodopila sp. TaxID=2480087 RepID=UPI002B537A67|nr:SDR family oxidoreductase [Rhodopila sp.]HVY14342.1 SDR family oxidoreductase [Rhodopila sp.]